MDSPSALARRHHLGGVTGADLASLSTAHFHLRQCRGAMRGVLQLASLQEKRVWELPSGRCDGAVRVCQRVSRLARLWVML